MYNVVLISAVQQSVSVLHIYTFFFIFFSIMVYFIYLIFFLRGGHAAQLVGS